jgi:hypothetical protein
MLMRLSLFIAAFWAASALASDWPVPSREADRALPSGAMLHRFTVKGDDEVDFTVVQFEAAKCSLRIIDQTSRKQAVTLASAMQGIHAIAGVNGGFFTTAFEPLGLTICDGKRVGSWMRSSLLGGVVVVKPGRLMLLWRDELQSEDGITQLLQAGPRLVNNTQPVSGLEARSHRPRTFIATDNGGQWLLGIAQSTTLANLARILATPGLLPRFEIQRALNFDGGKSTGLWAQLADGHVVHEAEVSTVRNFVAIVPRK